MLPCGAIAERIPPFVVYGNEALASDRGAYLSGDPPCINKANDLNAMALKTYEYTNGRFGSKPSYGYGCFYDLIALKNSGYPEGTVIKDWFGQNWVLPRNVCPDGYIYRNDYAVAPSQFYCERLDPAPKPACPPCNGDAGNHATPWPVRLGTGEKTLTEVDVDATPGGLKMVRTYRTRPVLTDRFPSIVGAQWQASFQQRVVYAPALPWAPAAALVVRPDGSMIAYRQDPATAAWVPDGDVTSTLAGNNGFGRPTAWTFTTENSDVEQFDGSGLLLSITARSGLTQTLTYSTRATSPATAPWPALVTAVADSFGRALRFSYDSRGRLAQVVDANGGVHRYAYDASVPGNLTAVTFPDGATRRYLYNESGLNGGGNRPNGLTGIVDELGQRYATYAFDASGRVTAEERAGGVDRYLMTYTQLADGMQTSVTDPLGTVRTHRFGTILGTPRPLSLDRPCTNCGGAAKAFTYDGSGNVASRTDFNGRKSCHAYDLARNLETARVEGLLEAEGCGAALASPPARADVRRIATSWHPGYRLPVQVVEPAPGGIRTTSHAYDGSGNLTQKTITAPRNDGTGGTIARTWSWTYGTLGRVATATDPNGNVTTYRYHADDDPDPGKRGNLASVTNPLGHVTQITSYDASGRPLAITDANGRVTTLTYHPRGWLAGRTVGGEQTTYGYDGAGQLTRVTMPDGSSLTYAYDSAHRLTEIRDGLGNRIAYALDAMGNRIREDLYDPASVLARTRSRAYDALNRLAADIGAQSQSTGFTYDANGNLLTVTDPLARRSTNAYDALNRLLQVTDAAGGVTRYAYDAGGNLAQVTDPRDVATRYTHDGLGNPTQQVSPDTGTTTSTYDAAGNLVTRTDARGVTATYTYDALRRVTRIVYGGAGAASETHAFAYDTGANAKGRLTQVADPVAVTAWTYDVQGRVATKSQAAAGLTQSVAYTYNGAGQLASLTTPSGQALRYTYRNNRVAGITVNGAPLVSTVVATPFGPIGAWQWGNGLYTFRDYDTDGRLEAWEFRNGVSVVRNDVTWDAANRITGIADPADAARTGTYRYDVLDRLTVAQQGNPVSRTLQYGYDPVGNRLNVTADGTLANLGYDAGSNRLLLWSGDLGPEPLRGDTARSYTYNLANRLARMETSRGVVAVYQVSALGQRVAKAVGTTVTRFVYDEQGRLLGEYDGTGRLIQETVWLEDLPVATLRPTGGNGTPTPVAVYYVHADHLGTPRAVTRPSDNAVMWRWSNDDPFGANPADENPSGQGPFTYALRFPGQYHDAETGSHYNYFRDYEPGVGRYVQSDPIGLDAGNNTYAYALSNPITKRDVFGLDTCGSGFLERLVPDNPFMFPFSSCCRNHDNCYDNCWTRPTQADCDDRLCGCMKSRCQRYSYVRSFCEWTAQKYCDAVILYGYSPFNEARKRCNGPSC
jgi:RHS repeat-associated protein